MIQVKATAVTMVPIDAIEPATYNPREMDESARAGLNRILTYHGLVEPLVVNKRTSPEGKYTLVGGHQRYSLLHKAGLQEVPCVILDISREDEKALNIALNNGEAQGRFIREKHRDILMMLDVKGDRELLRSTGHTTEGLLELLSNESGKELLEEEPRGHRHSEPTEHVCPNCGHLFRPAKETRAK